MIMVIHLQKDSLLISRGIVSEFWPQNIHYGSHNYGKPYTKHEQKETEKRKQMEGTFSSSVVLILGNYILGSWQYFICEIQLPTGQNITVRANHVC